MFTISVILPTYNGGTRGEGKYLKQAIESVLNQSYSNFELIIINDGSKDNTEEIIQSYRDKRIIYIKNEENKGAYSARNKGLKNATGTYIAFLDDDDFYYSNKLKDQFDFMVDNKSYVSLSDMDVINANGIKYATLKNKKYFSQVKDICKGHISPAPSSLMFKRDLIYDIGYFKDYLRSAEDFDYILRIATKYNIDLIPIALNAYRKHSSNITSDSEMTYIYGLFVTYELKDILLTYYNNDINVFYYDTFLRYTKWRYYNDNFHEFRACYNITKMYGKMGFIWHIKYLLSYLPFLVLVLKRLRRLCKKYV